MTTNNLKERCKIVTQTEEDKFVGVKSDNNNPSVYFPLGYNLPKTDVELRRDILHLFNVLNEFLDRTVDTSISQDISNKLVEFPLNSYLEIIKYYMENGYYIETDPKYATRRKGKIDWSKTIHNQKPLLTKNKDQTSFLPIYTLFTVKELNPNINKEITLINQYCVYESFEKLGWLFTSYMPQKPKILLNSRKFLTILHDKLRNTNNDIKKRLFQSMIDMIEFMDKIDNKKNFYFGTNNFEVIWEKLIDKCFGITDKENYFPRAKWNLQKDKSQILYPLQPDTIMIYRDKIFVIDAKYYKYGDTKNPQDLPNVSSVNKQITYGEYIQNTKTYNDIYNAFLMPYNMKNNLFNFDEPYMNIGEAISEWRTNKYKYEHIQGILVDIKYLMYNYTGSSKRNIEQLAKVIEDAFEKNNLLYKQSIQI